MLLSSAEGLEACRVTDRKRTMNTLKRLKSEQGSAGASASIECLLSERFSPQCGRYLVATHDIVEGSLILKESPAAALAFSDRGRLCDYCLDSLGDSGHPCSGGCGVLFCSTLCAEAAAKKFHTPGGECAVLRLANREASGGMPCGETNATSIPDMPDRFLIR
eukprot:3586972-Pyramimonas_sp.AAC.1